MGLQKHDPRSLKETQKPAMKETGTPHVHVNTRFNKALEHNEDADSTNRLYTPATMLSVTTF
ncbi:hypothetical protein FD754_004341 [Muntiacus muntjak]|uniref:Uncharacterized protein n=1 Tax=Muntiacus muntjak TaxID=9888 RepID=A0A5N3WHJ6_MUNMU|nr:hypothetical protein FD754_004341 [Muntiacus muntjak]